MVNVGAEKTLIKLMIETGTQTSASQQSATDSNHATTIQTRRVLELQEQIISTKSSSRVNRKSNGLSVKLIVHYL